MIASRAYRPSFKPAVIPQIDRKSRWADQLVFCAMGYPLRNIVDGDVATAAAGLPASGLVGVGYNHTGSTTIPTWAVNAKYELDGDLDFTIAVCIDILTAPSVDNYRGIISHRDTESAAGRWNLLITNINTYKWEAVGFSLAVTPAATDDIYRVGRRCFVLRRRRGGTYSFFIDHIKYTDETEGTSLQVGSNNLRLGVVRNDADTENFPGIYQSANIWKRALSDSEIFDWVTNPFSVLNTRRTMDFWPDTVASGSSGTIAVTMANFSSDFAGTTTVLGTMAASSQNHTSSIAATTTVLGVMAASTENHASNFAGTTTILGTIAQTLADFTSSISGTTAIVGTISAVVGAFTSAISGTTTIVGTISASLASFTAGMSGVVGDAVAAFWNWCGFDDD